MPTPEQGYLIDASSVQIYREIVEDCLRLSRAKRGVNAKLARGMKMQSTSAQPTRACNRPHSASPAIVPLLFTLFGSSDFLCPLIISDLFSFTVLQSLKPLLFIF